MYKHILVPTDGSELSDRAVVEAVTLARTLGARLTAVTVSPPFHLTGYDPFLITVTPTQYERAHESRAREVLGDARAKAASAGVPCEVISLVNDAPWQAIIETAQRQGCDLVFMASHGRRGVAGMLLGSETQRVLTHCKVPVLVYR
ncbi:MAG TPA: universal stress protein [Myxococcaceae bacterium]|nr:universal stress protein [Myxococcaceae bacterium]